MESDEICSINLNSWVESIAPKWLSSGRVNACLTPH